MLLALHFFSVVPLVILIHVNEQSPMTNIVALFPRITRMWDILPMIFNPTRLFFIMFSFSSLKITHYFHTVNFGCVLPTCYPASLFIMSSCFSSLPSRILWWSFSNIDFIENVSCFFIFVWRYFLTLCTDSFLYIQKP